MKTIKIITIGLLTIFSISCKGPKIKPQIMCDISFQFERCRCRCYDLMNIKTTSPKRCGVESHEENWNLPILACDEISGFYIENLAKKIIPKARKIKRYYDDKSFTEKYRNVQELQSVDTRVEGFEYGTDNNRTSASEGY